MSRRLVTLPLIAAAAAGALLYAPVLAALVQQWFVDTTTAHGILLAGAAAVVIYRRAPELRRLPLQPSAAGMVLVLLGLALYALGDIGAELFVLRLSLPIVALGCVVSLWGFHHARVLLAAFGLMLLAIPLPGVVVTSLTMPLQLVASRVAEGVLSVSQIPVVREGNLLMLPRATLEVAEACSGLRSATSLLSVAAVCAGLLKLRWQRGALLMLVSLPVAIIGNGFRVAATGILSQWIGEVATRGFIHDLTGVVAFIVMCVITISVLLLTRPARPRSLATSGARPLVQAP